MDRVEYFTQINLANELIQEYFADKVDKGGKPYIGHLKRVANSVARDKDKRFIEPDSSLSMFYGKAYITALLHDIVEDTEVTLDRLRLFFDEEIISAIDAITRSPHEKYYFDFIRRLSHNDIARLVKIYDLEDNMDIRRLTEFTEVDQNRIRKYWYCWRYLKGEIDEIECNNAIHPNRKL